LTPDGMKPYTLALFMKTQDTEHYMRMALTEAAIAADKGEVPVGAIIVKDQSILGRAHNQVELLHDPTAHAEMIAITQAAGALGDWRLEDTVLYVTKEPCPMCSGAIALARIPKVVFGIADPNCGGSAALAPHTEVVAGVLADDCLSVLQDFFSACRTPNGVPKPGSRRKDQGAADNGDSPLSSGPSI
jgi:tRNA(adenine34) deaminase